MKILAGILFVVIVPILCILLLWDVRRSKRSYTSLGWVLFIIGIFMTSMVVLTFIPVIAYAISGGEVCLFGEMIGFLVWFIPSLLMLLVGWRLRRKRKAEGTDKI